MTKTEAIQKAEAAMRAAQQALSRHALYVVTFGGNDDLTKAALREHDTAIEAHRSWLAVSRLHPRARASLIRRQELPVWMFGYNA